MPGTRVARRRAADMNDQRSHPPGSGGWLSLHAPGAFDVEHVGSKASGLARSAAGGLPTAPGWVLPVAADGALIPEFPPVGQGPPPGDISAALSRAHELLALAPDVPHWILRSSSPWEDRAEASAAGLLATETAPAVPEALAAAIATVVDSGRAAAVRALLGAPHGVPVAVLAQPLLRFAAWWTVEVRPTDGVLLLDGWRTCGAVQRAWMAQVPWPVPGLRTRTALPCGESDAEPPAKVLELAGEILRVWGAGRWQLEVGEHEGTALLLQVRPAPAVWVGLPEWNARARSAALPPSAGTRDDVPRFPLHPGDELASWRWDLEHCPTPLCPLLAGWFARWLSQLPASHPSRLVQGRWHDRQDPIPKASSQRQARAPWPIPATILTAAAWWEHEGAPQLRDLLDLLEARAGALAAAPRGWPQLMEQWLAFQRAYFDAPQFAAARAWARELVRALEQHDPPLVPPPLPDTEASRRARDLDHIARQWTAAAAGSAPAPTPRALQSALAAPATRELRAVADAIAAHRRRFAHEAIAPWDGRSACLEEDPAPLWRELARRVAAVPTPAEPAGHAPDPRQPRAMDRAGASSVFEARLLSGFGDPILRGQVRDAALLAVRILGWAEDDDTLLARSYALFRRAARTVARAVVESPLAEREVFEVLPADLEAQLHSPDGVRWRSAVRRGRALTALWEAHIPDLTGPERSAMRAGRPGEQRHGLAAAPGRATGRVRRLAHAQQDGGPSPGEVLVVPTLLPHDAVVLGRVAAVVVEGGTPLGHAAVLAREQGVPAVVAVRDALRWLSGAEQALVDGDQGSVTILPPVGARAAPNE